MKEPNKTVLYGLYDDEEDLIVAVKAAREADLEIMDVYTPFAVLGLDEAMGLSESRLHIAGFVYGGLGTLTAFGMMTWIFTSDWPIIFGGKPYFSAPAFIPITFELTVLFAAVGMVLTFYIVCGLGFGVTNNYLDDRITDDKFCIAFRTDNAQDGSVDKMNGFFKESGATEVHSKNIY